MILLGGPQLAQVLLISVCQWGPNGHVNEDNDDQPWEEGTTLGSRPVSQGAGWELN